MKTRLTIVLTLLLMLLMTACSGEPPKSRNTQDLHKVTEKKLGYISEFNGKENSFDFDEVEWLTQEDTEKLQKLGINPDDLPNGFYIHNPDPDKVKYHVDEYYEICNDQLG